MALVVSQAGTQTWASTGTKSITVSVSAGDVLAVIVGATDPATTVTNFTDNLGGTWTLGPSSPVSTGNLRGVTAWKVCAGGETSVSFDIGTGTTGQAFAVRVTGFAGTATLEASNEDEGGLSSVSTSIGTNSASNTTATAVAIALFTSDRADTVQDVSRSYSNSFTEVGFNGSSGSRAGAFAAAKVLSSAASQSTTFTTGDTGDEMYSAILVFGDVTGGSVESGAGSSAGSATASAVGASTAAAAGTSDGAATVSAVGASTAATAGTSAGAATAAGVGASTAEAVGTSAGTSTVSGVSPGGSTESGAGSAAGTSTAAATGASTAAAVGTSAGTATAEGVGAGVQTISAAGSAAGTSTATAVGADAAAETEADSLAGLRVHAAREAQFFFSKRRPARRTSRPNWPALRAA